MLSCPVLHPNNVVMTRIRKMLVVRMVMLMMSMTEMVISMYHPTDRKRIQQNGMKSLLAMIFTSSAKAIMHQSLMAVFLQMLAYLKVFERKHVFF